MQLVHGILAFTYTACVAMVGREPDPPPANWKSEYTWKCAAGPQPGKTHKQALTAHSTERTRVWNVERARLAHLVDEKDQTEKQNMDILKVDQPGEHQKMHAGGSCVPPIKPPPDSWRPDLSGEEREEAWKYAAGLDEDGKRKPLKAHAEERSRARHNAKISDIQAKPESSWTPPEHDIMDKEKARKLKEAARQSAIRLKKAKQIHLIEAKKGCGLTEEDRVAIQQKADQVLKQAATSRTNRAKPANRAKANARGRVRNKAKADARDAQRESDLKATAGGPTTIYGLGDVPRPDELELDARKIMNHAADVFYPNGAPLTSCSVVPHDGEKTYNVVVHGQKQSFTAYKSVLEDKATIAADRAVTKKRRVEMKAAAAKLHVDSTPNKKRKSSEPDEAADTTHEDEGGVEESDGGVEESDGEVEESDDMCDSGDETDIMDE